MPDITRRDWFRLSAKSKTDGRRIGQQSPGLQAIPQPVNHDGIDLSELPPMREALLSPEQIRELFADIETHAVDILLMQRSPGAARASASRATTTGQLAAARDSLLAGTVPRIQLRYRWDNTDWIDTLENRDTEFRLVRIAHRARL
ncbi:MAG: hypothetical protein JNK76_12770 [Planctomycetales bacterium]|nr:hypothetical protein [Planctomycetales bacterium]MBN8624730.1 hypothetical protein [Planctomycetota bacterium]